MLQSRLREAMQTRGIDLCQYKLIREGEETSTKDMEKKEAVGFEKNSEQLIGNNEEKAFGASSHKMELQKANIGLQQLDLEARV